MACLLAPVSAWSDVESLPSAADGQQVITVRIASLPLSHALDGVYPDYRECVRVDSFVSQGGERLDVRGTAHYVMRFSLTMTCLADCQWQLPHVEHHDRRAFVRALEEAACSAAAQSATGGISETEDFGFRKGTPGTQEELDGEIVFRESESNRGVAGIRDRGFGWQDPDTENLHQ